MPITGARVSLLTGGSVSTRVTTQILAGRPQLPSSVSVRAGDGEAGVYGRGEGGVLGDAMEMASGNVARVVFRVRSSVPSIPFTSSAPASCAPASDLRNRW